MKDTTGRTGLVAGGRGFCSNQACMQSMTVGPLACEGSQRYGKRRAYCSASCMVEAGDEPTCMVDACGGPAAYLSEVHGDRCEECRPGGCNNCALWGREACKLHRRVIRLAAMEDTTRIYEGVADGEANATHQGQHPAFLGAIPTERDDMPTQELQLLGGEVA